MKRAATLTRLFAIITTVTLLVLASPTNASAQCSNPTAPGSRLLPGTQCPEGAATTASALVWGLVVVALILWLVLAMARHRSATDADLHLIDTAFSQTETTEGATPATQMLSPGGGPSTAAVRTTPLTPSLGPTASQPAIPTSPPPLTPPPPPPLLPPRQ